MRWIWGVVGLLSLVPVVARAGEWDDYEAAFPAFACQDGWISCLSDGVRLDPWMTPTAGKPRPSNLRLDFFTFAPTEAFSPFATLSAYPLVATPPPAPEPDTDVDTEADSDSHSTAPDSDTDAVVDLGTGIEPDTEAPEPDTEAPEPDTEAPEPDTEAPEPDTEAPEPDTEAPEPDTEAPEPDTEAPEPDTEAPEPPGPVTCVDLVALETRALIGGLMDEQITCLEAAYSAASQQTEKGRISRLLMANAKAKGDTQGWVSLVVRHLEEVERSDPDICYAYALHLSRGGARTAASTIRWADVALENRSRWEGATYVSRVYALYKLRAQAAHAMWTQAEERQVADPSPENTAEAERTRGIAKTNAREWYEYAREAGRDTSIALQMCEAAAGTREFCEGG